MWEAARRMRIRGTLRKCQRNKIIFQNFQAMMNSLPQDEDLQGIRDLFDDLNKVVDKRVKELIAL